MKNRRSSQNMAFSIFFYQNRVIRLKVNMSQTAYFQLETPTGVAVLACYCRLPSRKELCSLLTPFTARKTARKTARNNLFNLKLWGWSFLVFAYFLCHILYSSLTVWSSAHVLIHGREEIKKFCTITVNCGENRVFGSLRGENSCQKYTRSSQIKNEEAQEKKVHT